MLRILSDVDVIQQFLGAQSYPRSAGILPVLLNCHWTTHKFKCSADLWAEGVTVITLQAEKDSEIA